MKEKYKEKDIRFILPKEAKLFKIGKDDSLYWKEGITYYWSRELLDEFLETLTYNQKINLKAHLKIQDEAKEDLYPEQTDKTYLVIALAPNHKFVYVNMEGFRVSVKIDPRYRNNLLGKKINVELTKDEYENPIYIHKP